MATSIMNRVRDRIQRVFPFAYGGSTKHDHYVDYGWPATLAFRDFHRAYTRNGLASAAIDKTIGKTWETNPTLWDNPDKPAESPVEQEVAKHFASKRIWQALANTDRRAMVGAYAGAILLLGDGQKLEQPVTRVPGGVKGLVGIIPAWEGQLSVTEWDTDAASPNYGLPLYFQFDETSLDTSTPNAAPRQIRIHPDRVLIWSEDGTINGHSTLEPGYNDLIDAEKVKGAGGEGFWKTARGTPIFEIDPTMSVAELMRSAGVNNSADFLDRVNDQVDDWNGGFDKALIVAGMSAKPLQITLPQPEQFFNIPVMSFAASMMIPVRVLIGNQTGERASTEDAEGWATTCMSRRANIVLPVLEEFVRRLVAWGVLPAKDWTVGWQSLMDATPDQRLDRAAKMAEINAKALPGDTPTFAPDEIREEAGYAAQDEVDYDFEEIEAPEVVVPPNGVTDDG